MTRNDAAGLGDTQSRDQLEQVHVPEDARAARFLFQFLGVALVCALAVAGMYMIVDPHDKFPSDAYRPLIVDWTESKLNLLDHQDQMPSTVILGSSRAMAISPSYVAEQGLGPEPAFSLAIPSSTARDHVLLYDYLVAQDARPESLVVALDLDVRPDITSVAVDSAAYPRLTGRSPDLIDEIADIGKAFSIGGIVDTGRVLYFNHGAGYPAERMVLLGDGATSFPLIEQSRASGTFDLNRAIEAHMRTQVREYYTTDQPSMNSIGFVEQLTRRAAPNGTQVHLFLPPVHPILDARVDESVPWLMQYEQAAVARLAGLCSADVTVYDLRLLETFGGDPDDFFDGWHYMHDNGRKLVDAMANGVGSIC